MSFPCSLLFVCLIIKHVSLACLHKRLQSSLSVLDLFFSTFSFLLQFMIGSCKVLFSGLISFLVSTFSWSSKWRMNTWSRFFILWSTSIYTFQSNGQRALEIFPAEESIQDERAYPFTSLCIPISEPFAYGWRRSQPGRGHAQWG